MPAVSRQIRERIVQHCMSTSARADNHNRQQNSISPATIVQLSFVDRQWRTAALRRFDQVVSSGRLIVVVDDAKTPLEPYRRLLDLLLERFDEQEIECTVVVLQWRLILGAGDALERRCRLLASILARSFASLCCLWIGPCVLHTRRPPMQNGIDNLYRTLCNCSSAHVFDDVTCMGILNWQAEWLTHLHRLLAALRRLLEANREDDEARRLVDARAGVDRLASSLRVLVLQWPVVPSATYPLFTPSPGCRLPSMRRVLSACGRLRRVHFDICDAWQQLSTPDIYARQHERHNKIGGLCNFLVPSMWFGDESVVRAPALERLSVGSDLAYCINRPSLLRAIVERIAAPRLVRVDLMATSVPPLDGWQCPWPFRAGTDLSDAPALLTLSKWTDAGERRRRAKMGSGVLRPRRHPLASIKAHVIGDGGGGSAISVFGGNNWQACLADLALAQASNIQQVAKGGTPSRCRLEIILFKLSRDYEGEATDIAELLLFDSIVLTVGTGGILSTALIARVASLDERIRRKICHCRLPFDNVGDGVSLLGDLRHVLPALRRVDVIARTDTEANCRLAIKFYRLTLALLGDDDSLSWRVCVFGSCVSRTVSELLYRVGNVVVPPPESARYTVKGRTAESLLAIVPMLTSTQRHVAYSLMWAREKSANESRKQRVGINT